MRQKKRTIVNLLGFLLLFLIGVPVAHGQSYINPANGHLYYLTPSTMTANDARDYAWGEGGYLTCINDQDEQDWLVATFGSSAKYWIGASDELQEGTWLWDSGEPWSFTAWCPGEPNNWSNEDYAVLNWRSSGCWNDWHEYHTNYGIVEIPDTTPPVTTIHVERGNEVLPGIFNTDASFSLEATDDQSGVMVTWYSIDGEPELEYVGIFDVTGSDKHYVEYYSVDWAGNVEPVNTYRFIIDKDPPVSELKITGEPPDRATDNDVYLVPVWLVIKAEDELTGVDRIMYAINGEEYEVYEDPIYLDEPGDYGVIYYAVDVAENVEPANKVAFTLIDLQITPPPGCLTNKDCNDAKENEYCKKKEGDCQGYGECTPRPTMCPYYWYCRTVCGCDGRDYCDACTAAMAGVNVAYQGSCSDPGPVSVQ